MSYEIKKPITEKQKVDFIVEYNHNQGLKIEEGTDTYEDDELTFKGDFLFALEPNEIMETVENFLVREEGYSLDETDIIPFGFFKQTINGIIYRLLCAIKKKSSDSPTLFDIIVHKHNNEFKIISSTNLEESTSDLSEKNKNKMEAAIMKYYFDKLYTLKEMEIEYEYHKLGGLYDYAIYDVKAKLEVEEESVDKRLLIVYRNDRTFTVEEELKAED